MKKINQFYVIFGLVIVGMIMTKVAPGLLRQMSQGLVNEIQPLIGLGFLIFVLVMAIKYLTKK